MVYRQTWKHGDRTTNSANRKNAAAGADKDDEGTPLYHVRKSEGTITLLNEDGDGDCLTNSLVESGPG